MKSPQATAPLPRNGLLVAIPESELAIPLPHLGEGEFKSGTMLQEIDAAIDRVYFPRSGMISVVAVMNAGDAVETATVGQEGAVGMTAGLYDDSRATGRAIVQLDGVFSHIAAAPFRTAVAQSPTLRGFISRYNDVHTTLVSQVAGCNALHPATARLCRWVLQARDRNDSDILSLTHEFLAGMLGVQRTTVTLLARELQDGGLIAYRRGQVTIIDREGLEAKSCECYEAGKRRIADFYAEKPTIRLTAAGAE